MSSSDSGVENSNRGRPGTAGETLLAQVKEPVRNASVVFHSGSKQRVPARALRLCQHLRSDVIHGVALDRMPQSGQNVVPHAPTTGAGNRTAQLRSRPSSADCDVVFSGGSPPGAMPSISSTSGFSCAPKTGARRRERFDITALALGVDRVECERDFPDPRRPVTTVAFVRDLKRDILQIVDARPRMEMSRSSRPIHLWYKSGRSLHPDQAHALVRGREPRSSVAPHARSLRDLDLGDHVAADARRGRDSIL